MTSTAASTENLIGRLVLGRYRIVRLLARGGMGSIYLARNRGAAGFVRPAVVKKILPSYLGDDSAAQMFAREARIMSNLRHPGIVNIIDFAEEDGAYVMVLEYVHGTHTGRWVRFLRKLDHDFPADVAVQILIQTLDALEYAHSATSLDGAPLAIIHRDIKPSNILVDVAGHVKLADFGIARAPNDRTEGSSASNKLKGTFPYLAPELFESAEPSPATDVYACGVVLHTLLSGRNEFSAKDVGATIMRVLEHIPTPLDRLRKDVSPELAGVIATSMDKDPGSRFQSAAELASALRKVQPMSDAQAKEALRKSAGEHLRDPRFAELLGIDDLATLERELTSEGEALDESGDSTDPSLRVSLGEDLHLTAQTVPSPLLAQAGDPATRILSENESKAVTAAAATLQETGPVPGQAPRRSWPIAVALVAGAVIIAGAIIAGGVFRDSAEPAQVIVVDKNQRGATPPREVAVAQAPAAPPSSGNVVPASAADAAPRDADADADDSGAEPSAVDDDPAAAERRGHPHRKPDLQATIDHTMARRGPAFERCFEAQPEAARRVREVELEIKAARTGRVTSARVLDPHVAQSDLGRCLVASARSTAFGPLPRAIAFTIPLRTRVR